MIQDPEHKSLFPSSGKRLLPGEGNLSIIFPS